MNFKSLNINLKLIADNIEQQCEEMKFQKYYFNVKIQ